MNESRKRELLVYLVEYLKKESKTKQYYSENLGHIMPDNSSLDTVPTKSLWLAFRALVNVRPPLPADGAFLVAQDELLQGMIDNAGIKTLNDTITSPNNTRLHLWQGDITTLAVDAIVNAANSGMTGCWVPLHYCIDNAIHTFAGVQLRLECARIMEERKRPEPTATATLTHAYNLPAQHVIHTVGPIANGHPSNAQNIELARCYESCLTAAQAKELSSLAFCCISTGVFGFPQRQAAQIAITTVREWLNTHEESEIDIVFNTFLDEDDHYYRELLGL